MSTMRKFFKDCIPPIVLRAIRQLKADGNIFEGDYACWEQATATSSGYDAEDILDKVLRSTLKVKHGLATAERDSVLFDEIKYDWFVVAGLMWVAARNGGVLNVLDFGGALGSSYFQNRKFLQPLTDVHWNVVEQEHYVEAGRKHIQDDQLRFYKTIEECLTVNQPNVILLSSVLQYLESPADLISVLSKVGAQCLLIDRTPFAMHEKDKLVVQKVPTAIYSASYPMWIFSLSEFEKLVNENWCQVASTVSPEGYARTTKNHEFLFTGMMLEKCQ